MKTSKHLYAQVVSFENLYWAAREAARGKRGHPDVAAFEFCLEANLLRLQEDLSTKRYRPLPYDSFRIHDPKPRLISAADFRDRVVHHALVRVIEPIFERSFIADSYANRVGKGTHHALDRCQEFARRYRYVLQCDVRQFFPAVDNAILRGILARKIGDPDVMWLVNLILSSGVGVLSGEYDMVWFPGDDLFAVQRPRGGARVIMRASLARPRSRPPSGGGGRPNSAWWALRPPTPAPRGRPQADARRGGVPPPGDCG